MWSSRAASAATYTVEDSELRLTIPAAQGHWCEGDHQPPLRVSGIQSGIRSGPVGSTSGQQPFREGQSVREAQPEQWGWTPGYGTLQVRARMELGPSSMASVWLVGLEDAPDRCGEICLFEVFGDALVDGNAAVGMGVKPIRDPQLTGDFEAPRLELDVAEHHVYAARWEPGRVEFSVDGEPTRTVEQAPAYPVQAMGALFDFPEKGVPERPPLFAIDWIRGPASAGEAA